VLRQFNDAAAHLPGTRRARRILKVGNNVEELGDVLFQRRFQRFEVRPVFLQRNTHHVGLMPPQQGDGAIVRGRFGEDHVAGPHPAPQQELHDLQ
jgi:hypothetical protein